MKTIHTILVIVFFILFSSMNFSDASFNFLNDGNVFVYDAFTFYSYYGGSSRRDYPIEKRIISDTLINDAHYKNVAIVSSNKNELWILDSTGFFIGDECFYYANIKSDTSWIDTVQTNSGVKYINLSINQLTEEWLGVNINVQRISKSYWETQITIKYSEYFGILDYFYNAYQIPDGQTQSGYTLAGAVITDTLYGDTTISGVNMGMITPPAKIKLHQNYPNPFNSETNISYSIPYLGFVCIKIYNIIGQEIKILVNKYQGPGEYTVIFDALNLTSGIYYYVLYIGNIVSESRKMILIR